MSVLIHKHWIERIKVMPGLKPEHIFEIKNWICTYVEYKKLDSVEDDFDEAFD